MITAIVIDEAGNSEFLRATSSAVAALSNVGEVMVVSDQAKPEWTEEIAWINNPEGIMAGLATAASKAASKRVCVFSSCLAMSPTELAAFTTSADERPLSEHFYAPVAAQSGLLDLPSFTPENLVQIIARYDVWPVVAVATSRNILSRAANENTATPAEAMATSMILAVAQSDAVEVATTSARVISESIFQAICEFSDSARSRMLNAAIDNFNIEELFPDHAWSEFSAESAAAAYHSITALFIRFGDIESANESLKCSETLEESPRYFALKGLIAKGRGETLGAVANMVSSLQCYETRKKSSGVHYLSFSPRDLEVINSRLVDGLDALNKRENERALDHFSEAVINFDSFYTDMGVLNDRIK